MVGFRQSSEEQAVNWLVYQPWQSEGVVAVATRSYSGLPVGDEPYMQNGFLFEGDWTVVLECLEGVTASLKYMYFRPTDKGLQEMSWAVCQPNMYAQAGAKKEQYEVLRLLTDNRRLNSFIKYWPW